ncbi:piwi-like protein 1 [Trichosurus vulpecula]|uniref:piwi-like protein 1 n=1 Tax=Trichosurus vulpecula TaxID=9337 RepID=UPI00186AD5A5|nr:piwi-like protein 1 [Trichosurus vulpecula]
MSGRARKNRMARGRPPREAQSGASVEGQQPGNGSSRYGQQHGQGRQAPEPVSVPALAVAQARDGTEILTQLPATARQLTWSEVLVHQSGRARAAARARAPLPIPIPPAVTPAQAPAAQASTAGSELVSHEEPRGAEGGAEEGASTFPEEGEISDKLKELSQRKRQSGRHNFHDLGVNTRQKLHHFIECKRGTSGTVVHLKTNHFRLTSLPQWTLYQYHVNFNPQMDSKRLRSILLDMHKQLLGKCYSFDGTILFLCHTLQNKVTEVFSQTHSGENVRITITLTNELLPNSPTCLQFYNILFKRLLNIMKLVQIGCNFYDIYNGAEDMRDLGLNICPGFITSILQYENDIMLCTDVSHKVVRKDTILDLINDFQKSPRPTSQEEILKEIRGQIVYTKHNNRTYRVDDIDWEQNPRSTIKKDGSDISFLDYYRQQYRIKITDLEQPVLVSLPKRKKGPDRRPTNPALLMPELCNLTGLTRSMRRNDRITKNISKCTRLSPERRHSELQKLIDNIHRNADVQRELQEWGLNFEKQSLSLTGRVLPVQILNEDSEAMSIQCTDWSKEIKRGQLSYPKPLVNWLFAFNHENSRLAQILWEKLNLTTRTLGINLSSPKWCPVQGKIEEYLKVLNDNVTSQTQIALCLLPNNKKDKYDAIKKYLCTVCPVPSQCIVAETLKKPHILLAVVTRLALQMNCKIGGHLWKVSVPLTDTMFIGIDCFHDITSGHQSVAGFVASLDTSLTRWYSCCLFQKTGQEFLDGLKVCLESALKAWKKNNKQCPLPKFIFVYRDGVGDGQLQTMVDYEVPQILGYLNSLPNYSYKLVIIVVKKRVNARFFVEKNGHLVNPNAGTVIDMEVTRPEWYDFFIISQSVKAGSVTPTHYNVIFDNTDLNPDQIQCLTYKLCYIYYNWTGVIRVPAPCQYAHKLALLVGQSIHRHPSKNLSDRLYYL